MRKRNLSYHNADPTPGLVIDDPSKREAREEFARRIQKLMAEKGWNQSELARAASKFMPDKKEMGRFSISNYVRGNTIPRPDHLIALAQALNVKPQDLLPTRGVPGIGPAQSPAELEDIGNNRVRIRLQQETDWDTALTIMKLLKTHK